MVIIKTYIIVLYDSNYNNIEIVENEFFNTKSEAEDYIVKNNLSDKKYLIQEIEF